MEGELGAQSPYKGRVEIGECIALSAGAYTTTLGWANCSIIMECMPDSGNCHLCVYSVAKSFILCEQSVRVYTPQSKAGMLTVAMDFVLFWLRE